MRKEIFRMEEEKETVITPATEIPVEEVPMFIREKLKKLMNDKKKVETIEEADTKTASSPTLPKSPNLLPTAKSIQTASSITSAPSALTTTNNSAIQSAVTKAISESEDLVAALEAVGAMYGIPSENILVDNSLKSIKVVGDCMSAPELPNPSANSKAIMCAIGGVLDHISQRIDDKLNDYQFKNIESGRNPIPPETKPPEVTQTGLQYFADEDDITKDIDVNDSSTDVVDTSDTNDVANDIQESYQFLDVISRFNNTRQLGYELLQSQGFGYVRSTYVQESDTSSKKKSKKDILPSDIKHMKFDNTNLLKAIDYFNKAREEQSENERGSMDLKKFATSENYQKGLDCLNKQFNARIIIRFFDKEEYESNLFTDIYDDIKTKLTISKSKGFQLSGLPISIFLLNDMIDSDAPKDPKMFGQNFVSSVLHEVFHNIAAVIRFEQTQFNTALSSTMMIASGIENTKDRRIFLTNFVNTLDNYCGLKLNRFKRRVLVKNLMVTAEVQNDHDVMEIVKNKVEERGELTDEDIDEIITVYERRIKSLKLSKKPIGGIMCAIGAVGFLISSLLIGPVGFVAAGFAAMISLMDFAGTLTYRQMLEARKSEKHMEEFYCDLFAAMYQLPVTFFTHPGWYTDPNNKKVYTPNEIDKDKMNKLAMLEKELFELCFVDYPSNSERNHAAVTAAQKMLDSGEKLDPSIEKYIKWIVDNFSSIKDTDIKEIYNQTTFDPETAENLDKHLENLIKDHDITLTEYATTSTKKNRSKDLTTKSFIDLVNDAQINEDVVQKISKSHKTSKLPPTVKKIISLIETNESAIVINGSYRVISSDKLSDNKFIQKKLIPLIDADDKEYIVYQCKNDSYAKFDMDGGTILKQSKSLEAMLK